MTPTADRLVGPEFTADAVIELLRAGGRPNAVDAKLLDRMDLMDELRSRVTEDDLGWILDSVDDDLPIVAGFSVSLLRKYCHREDVQSRLRRRWEDADASLRNRIMWRLLDDPDLPQLWHQKVFDVIRDDWETFRGVVLDFRCSQEDLIPSLLRRIGDPTFPESKKWIYACAATAATDRLAAMALISLFRSATTDSFAQEVADLLLAEFENSEQRVGVVA